MKPLHFLASVIGVSLILSTSLYADHDRHDRDGHRWDRESQHGHRWDRESQHSRMSYNNHSHNNWVIPLVVGGVLGYALSEPRYESVTYTRAPVVYAPQPVYQEEWVYFSDCDCQRKVLVRVR
ncbi:MAG: hypothetical protein ACXWVX_09820 [Sulfuricurvum sp.]